jgi:hypothetical protein
MKIADIAIPNGRKIVLESLSVLFIPSLLTQSCLSLRAIREIGPQATLADKHHDIANEEEQTNEDEDWTYYSLHVIALQAA